MSAFASGEPESWRGWHEEIFADACSVLLLGPAAATVMVEMLRTGAGRASPPQSASIRSPQGGKRVRLGWRGQCSDKAASQARRAEPPRLPHVVADKSANLPEDHTGDTVRKHIHGDVGPDRIEAAVREEKPLGHIGHHRSGHRAVPGSRPFNRLTRRVNRSDRITRISQPPRTGTGSAPQLKDRAHACLPQRDQERLGPQASQSRSWPDSSRRRKN